MFKAGVAIAALAGLAAAQTTTLQAESATLSGVTVATSVAGYTGAKLPLSLHVLISNANILRHRLRRRLR
jgi:hypothetical protein